MRVHVVALDSVPGERDVWLVGRISNLLDVGEPWAEHYTPHWVDGTYNFTDSMHLARELDRQFEPGDCL